MKTETLKARRASTAGFTLIELIAAMAVIAAIVHLFLPAVQKQREEMNRAAAEQELKSLAGSLEAYFRKSGGYPATLSDKALNFTYQSGGKAGYRLMVEQMDPRRVRVVSEPVPGVTGSQTGVLEAAATPLGPQVSVRFVPAPGADENRKRMFAEVLARGADAWASLGAGQSEVLSQVRSYMHLSGTLEQSFNSMRGANGRVSFASLTEKAPSALWDQIEAAMQLGANGETVAAFPGLSSLPAVQQDFHFFSWDELNGLTQGKVADAALQQKLMQHLAAAVSAESAGDLAGKQRSLAAYRGELEAHQATYFSWGKPAVLNFFDAEVLITVAKTL